MKAVQVTEYANSGNIKVVEDVEKPAAAADQVLVEVHAVAINPFDVKLTTGFYKEYIPLQPPYIPGSDVAGTVAEIGNNVNGFEVGQEVYGMANAAGGHGSFAEFANVNASQLVAKPASTDFNQAAALPLTAVSAYQSLVDHMNLQPGQKILIHGGAGGIGSLAIQIAKNIGAYVATTAADTETDFVKGLGADEVIDYKTQDFSELLNDYDAVFDTVGGETNVKSYKVLKNGGSFVSMLEAPNEDLVKEKNIQYTQQNSQATQERLNAVRDLVDSSKLKVNIDKIFPLDQAAEAFEYQKTGHPKGKVVIQIK